MTKATIHIIQLVYTVRLSLFSSFFFSLMHRFLPLDSYHFTYKQLFYVHYFKIGVLTVDRLLLSLALLVACGCGLWSLRL